MRSLPRDLQRATRAAVELYGASPQEAVDAAVLVHGEFGDVDHYTPEDWLSRLRKHLPDRKRSGLRRASGAPDASERKTKRDD